MTDHQRMSNSDLPEAAQIQDEYCPYCSRPMTSDLMTVRQAAKYLGIAPRTLEDRRFRERIGLPTLRIGQMIRFQRSELIAFVEKQQERLQQQYD